MGAVPAWLRAVGQQKNNPVRCVESRLDKRRKWKPAWKTVAESQDASKPVPGGQPEHRLTRYLGGDLGWEKVHLEGNYRGGQHGTEAPGQQGGFTCREVLLVAGLLLAMALMGKQSYLCPDHFFIAPQRSVADARHCPCGHFRIGQSQKLLTWAAL